jgi:hypothetical protein
MQSPIPLPSAGQCPHCGQAIENETGFCAHCGARLVPTTKGMTAGRVLGAIALSVVALVSGAAGGCFLLFSSIGIAGGGWEFSPFVVVGLLGLAIAYFCLRAVIKMLRSR